MATAAAKTVIKYHKQGRICEKADAHLSGQQVTGCVPEMAEDPIGEEFQTSATQKD